MMPYTHEVYAFSLLSLRLFLALFSFFFIFTLFAGCLSLTLAILPISMSTSFPLYPYFQCR